MTGDKNKRRGKHKRGERGSIEEEENRKRINMASEDNAELSDEETSEVQEPSNLELKEMLVDIKIELSNIARENKKFAKEIAELRKLIYDQKIELDSLKASIKETENKNTAMEAELFAARNKIDEQEDEIAEPTGFKTT